MGHAWAACTSTQKFVACGCAHSSSSEPTYNEHHDEENKHQFDVCSKGFKLCKCINIHDKSSQLGNMVLLVCIWSSANLIYVVGMFPISLSSCG